MTARNKAYSVVAQFLLGEPESSQDSRDQLMAAAVVLIADDLGHIARALEKIAGTVAEPDVPATGSLRVGGTMTSYSVEP